LADFRNSPNCQNKLYANFSSCTVVWKKFVVENIHIKIIYCKNFCCCWHPTEIFYSEIFTIEFFQFKLGAVSPVSVEQEAVTH